jgi:hypothetical protein
MRRLTADLGWFTAGLAASVLIGAIRMWRPSTLVAATVVALVWVAAR